MHRNPRPDSIWLMPILAGWFGVVVTQASFTLAFAPSGRSLRMSVESKGEMVLVGIPGTPDSAVVETFALAGVTQRAERIEDGRFSLDVTYDSLRARHRTGAESWIDGQFAFTTPVTIGFTTDRLMMLSVPIYSGDSATAERARSGAGAPHFVLPSAPVDVGGPWHSEVLLPFAAEIPGTPVGIVTATLNGPAIGLLDSMVPRGEDTLPLSFGTRAIPTGDSEQFRCSVRAARQRRTVGAVYQSAHLVHRLERVCIDGTDGACVSAIRSGRGEWRERWPRHEYFYNEGTGSALT